MYDELTPAEKGKVTQGQPNIEVLHDQENIKLIYTKIIEHSKSSDSNNIKNTSINENTIFKNTDILPKTGENNHNIYWILGIILIFLSIAYTSLKYYTYIRGICYIYLINKKQSL